VYTSVKRSENFIAAAAAAAAAAVVVLELYLLRLQCCGSSVL
jgi:hypothetical protein